MDIGGLRFGRLAPGTRDRLLAAARAGALTYSPVGRTLDPAVPTSAALQEHHVDVGRGEAAYEAAREAIRTWVPHHGIGATIEPAGQPIELGATVLVVLRRGPIYVIAPDRIVAVVDEPRRFGWAYGTLPDHAERGEESFLVEWRDDDVVRFTIRVEADVASLPARLIAPIVRWLQAAALRGYLRAVADHVRQATGGGG